MCSLFRLIRLFTLSWLFLVLLGLPSVSFSGSGYYTFSNANFTKSYADTSAPDAVCSDCMGGNFCKWAQYNQTPVSVSVSGTIAGPVCAIKYRIGSSSELYDFLWNPSPVSHTCTSGTYNESTQSCSDNNSCISGVAVAGSGFPVATPGHEGDGHSITYCSSAKCVMTAWESLNISYCADNSPSCPPITISRSEGRQTGAVCSNSNVPANPAPECAGGMSLLGGVCVCPAGARLQGGVCRQNIDCSTAYHRVNDSCIADACPAGEIIQDNKCIPDPRSTVKNNNPASGEPPIACAAGRHYDTSLSSCVANTSADGGTSGSPGTPGNPSAGSGGVGGGLPGESGSAESSDCAQPPVCAGDAVQCALLTQVWRNHCDSVPQSVVDAHPVPPVESVDLSTSAIASLNAPAALTFAAVCPADKNFSIMGQSYVLSWQPVCDGAAYLKPLIIAIGFLHGLYVVFSIRKGE